MLKQKCADKNLNKNIICTSRIYMEYGYVFGPLAYYAFFILSKKIIKYRYFLECSTNSSLYKQTFIAYKFFITRNFNLFDNNKLFKIKSYA